LRPKGAPVRGVGADASGPLSFMDVWDAMCRTIMSAGHRRGAMMATMRCDHPDIEAFIEAKRAPERLRMFNLSVLVTDAFMLAVKEDGPWELKFNGTTFRVVPARELWDRIMRSTYAAAEPEVFENPKILQLDGHVEVGGRFIGDDQFRPAGERRCPDNTLPHTAAHLVRVVVHAGLRRGNAHHAEQADDALTQRLAAQTAMIIGGLTHLIQNGKERVE
jgi:hypothetical protein